MRAGESYSESFGEPLTNPVWKTSERHGLSPLGKEQVTNVRGLEAASRQQRGGGRGPDPGRAGLLGCCRGGVGHAG